MHSHRNIQHKRLQETTEYYLLQLLLKGELTAQWDQSPSGLVQFWVSTRSGAPKINRATTSRQWPPSTWTIFSEYLIRNLLAATPIQSPILSLCTGLSLLYTHPKVVKKTAIKIPQLYHSLFRLNHPVLSQIINYPTSPSYSSRLYIVIPLFDAPMKLRTVEYVLLSDYSPLLIAFTKNSLHNPFSNDITGEARFQLSGEKNCKCQYYTSSDLPKPSSLQDLKNKLSTRPYIMQSKKLIFQLLFL